MSVSEQSSPELARETLRMLAARKLPPTPDNYSAIFNEISGAPPPKERAHRALALALEKARWVEPGQRADWLRLARAGDWDRALGQLMDAAGPGSDAQRGKLLEQLARLIEYVQPALGEDDPYIQGDAVALAADCRRLGPAESMVALCTRLNEFNQRLAFVSEEQAEVRASLIGMLRLIFENVGELAMGDAWMEAQVALLVAACDGPLSLRRLDDLKRRLKDVIFKQGELKRATLQAQEGTRQMFLEFVGQLSGMAQLSSARSAELAACAAQIAAARDLSEVGSLVSAAVGSLNEMAERSGRLGSELASMHARMSESEAEVARLRRDLDALSLANRHDALTGALNRKGLEEALVREVARARRLDSPLCLALIDIDNFKEINDQHGHPAGDGALGHLADMARTEMRAQDTLCRYGGEEFVILMPDTPLDDGVEAIRKLQRALIRNIFMADSRKIMITFSAGVAMLGPHEEPQAAIERADRGMYQAKRTGKNRVLVA
jgi:diguanylate cyclase